MNTLASSSESLQGKTLRLWIQKEIKSLSSAESNEIFRIIQQDTDKYSENPNGVFINLKNVSEATLGKIRDFIVFRKDQTETMKEEQRFHHLEKKTSAIAMRTRYASTYHQPKPRKSEDTFTFQNYIDKLSITNMKSFPTSHESERIHYPSLKNVKCKFSGVKARILKRCKEINRAPIEVNICNNIQNDVENVRMEAVDIPAPLRRSRILEHSEPDDGMERSSRVDDTETTSVLSENEEDDQYEKRSSHSDDDEDEIDNAYESDGASIRPDDYQDSDEYDSDEEEDVDDDDWSS